jgi:vitamin B12 transporter
MSYNKSAIAMACVPLFVNFVNAQEVSSFNPIVVSGARFEQPLSEVLPSVTVITKEEIQRSQARSVAEVLQGEPGVEIGANGGLGAMTSFFLRGENSVNTAIYVDGVRVQPDGLGSLNNTSFPPLQSIERIEVLRGNAGALYGEAAIGGVIHIFTNAGANQPPKAFVTTTYGTYNTVDVNAGIAGRVGDTTFNISANDLSSSGFAPISIQNYPSASTTTGNYQGSGLNVGVSQIINQDIEIGLKDRHQDNSYNYTAADDYGVPVNQGILMRTISNDATIFAKFNLSKDWTSQLDFTNASLNYGYTAGSPGNYSVPNSTVASTNTINWVNGYQLASNQKLSFGVSYSNQRFDNGTNTLGNIMTRQSTGAYLGDSIQLGRFDVQLNGRYDSITVNQPDAVVQSLSNSTNQTFTALTGLFGVGYHLTDELRLTASTSSGFRAPSAMELFPGTYCGSSYSSSCYNPNLMPELHRTTEAGIEYKNGFSLSRAVYFQTTTDNAISYIGAANQGYINIPTVQNKGIEISERAKWRGYQLVAAYTHQNPVDVSTNVPLTRRASDFGSMDLNKSFGLIDAGAKVIISGPRSDFDYTTDPLTPQTLGSYQIWSFYGGYKINDEFNVRLRLDNAFNQNYQLAYGYNTPGRTAWITLIYQQK